MSPFRPRISLLSALLVMTIIGMGIVIVQLWREVGPLREEVDRLRSEVGYLAVDDPTKVHAVRVDARDELTWRWRVWIPKGQVYMVRSVASTIPKKEFPTNGGSTFIRGPGEHVIEYRIDRDRNDDKWYGSLVTVGSSVGKDNHPWVDWKRRFQTGGGVGRKARAFELGERVELIRNRVSQTSDSEKMENVTAGFMVWLEAGGMAAAAAPATKAMSTPPAQSAEDKK